MRSLRLAELLRLFKGLIPEIAVERVKFIFLILFALIGEAMSFGYSFFTYQFDDVENLAFQAKRS